MGEWMEICGVDEIPENGARTVRVAKTEIALFRLGDGDVHALENRCPHKGGPLAEGIVSGHDVLCPLHNLRVNIDSGASEEGCVRIYETRIENGRVMLRL